MRLEKNHFTLYLDEVKFIVMADEKYENSKNWILEGFFQFSTHNKNTVHIKA